MITLNLISPEYKKTIKIKKILRDAQNLFLYITLITIITAIVLLIARKILEEHFASTIGQTSLISRNQTENKKIVEINKKIKLAQQIQQDYIPWSRLIIHFSKLVPDNIIIDSFNANPDANKNEFKISLSGTAVGRNDFLDFKKNLLEAKELFDEKDVEIPIANLFEKENVKFNINLKIKKEILANLELPDNCR